MTKVMTPKERKKWHELDGTARSEKDNRFYDDLEERGIAKHRITAAGNRYFSLTKKGEREMCRTE